LTRAKDLSDNIRKSLTRAIQFNFDDFRSGHKKRISSNKNIMNIYYSEKTKEKKRFSP
jgi:hypothetical protein